MPIVFCGDLHVGSSVAVCPPLVDMGEDGNYAARGVQLWLLERWRDFTREVIALAGGKKIILVLLGDLIDGPRQHGIYQTFGTARVQRDAAVELLRPLANISSAIYGCFGTRCHGGDSGENDGTVVKELGGECRYRWRLDIGGRLWNVAHHARRDSREWTQGNSTLAILRGTALRCDRTGERRPDYIVRGHAHEADVLTHNGMTAALCPSWKLTDEYTRKLDPASLPDIGGLIWQNEKLTPLLYPPAPDPITVVTAPTPNEY